MRVKAKGRAAAAAVLLMALLAACGSGTSKSAGASTKAPSGGGGQAALSALYTQAKTEGSVAVLAPPPANYMKPVLAQFEKAYPGISVRYQSSSDPSIITAVTTQEAASSVQVDLVADAMTYLPPLVPSMQNVAWSSLGAAPDAELPQNLGLRWFDIDWSIVYNTNKVKPSDVPHSWNDLLSPRFAGGTIVLNSGASYADAFLLDPSWGRTKALAFAKKLAAQKPLYNARPPQVLQTVSSGQALVGTAVAPNILAAKAAGQPVDIAPVSPQFGQHVDLFVPKGATHTAAAELLGVWLASATGRAALEKAAFYGYASPCSASNEAQYLCSKNITTVFFPTYKDFSDQGNPFDKAFNQALGLGK